MVEALRAEGYTVSRANEADEKNPGVWGDSELIAVDPVTGRADRRAGSSAYVWEDCGLLRLAGAGVKARHSGKARISVLALAPVALGRLACCPGRIRRFWLRQNDVLKTAFERVR